MSDDVADDDVAEDFDGIVIVGAGLVGAIAAVTLSSPKYGFNVRLYEARDDWRVGTTNIVGGTRPEDQHKDVIKRSINLALSHRGQMALANVGLLERVMAFTVPMCCRAIHSTDGNADNCNADSFQPYDEVDPSNFINSVSREGLNNLLLDEAEKSPRCELFFGHKLAHVDREGIMHLENDKTRIPQAKQALGTYNDYTPASVRVKPTLCLGCDGAYSSTREAMLRLLPMDFQRKYIDHGYKEMCIRPTPDGQFAIKDPEALHIWPRGEFMMIALPNQDKSFTCTLFAPFESKRDAETGAHVEGLRDITTPEQVKAYFARHFPDVVAIMPQYVEEFLRNPACMLVTISCRPWNWEDKVLLMGDAAHATVPFYGQGMNAGMEDVLAFAEALDAHGHNLAKAVPAFAESRRPAGNAIGDLSMSNYLVMRHHTRSKLFLLRKKVEGWLNWLFPKTWIPLYKMVAFTRIPYHEAVMCEARQDRMLTFAGKALACTAIVGAGLGIASAVLSKLQAQSMLWRCSGTK